MSCDLNTLSDTCPQVEQAARVAVKKVFAILGVDVDNPEKVEEFRKDLRFGQTMRKTAERLHMGIIGAVAIGIVVAIWAGVKTKLGN